MKNLLTVLLLLVVFDQTLAQKKKRKDYVVTLNTSYGTMRLVLFDQTPQHKENFVKLVKDGFYNELLFHRVINKFMIQGGDPSSRGAEASKALGSGGVDYKIPAEITPSIIHKKGTLAAARDNNPQKASSGCQFYIVQGQVWNEADFAKQIARNGRSYTPEQSKTYQTVGGSPHLDGNYTAFGEVIDGMAVLDSIAKKPCDASNRPLNDIKMNMTIELMRLRKIRKKYGYTF